VADTRIFTIGLNKCGTKSLAYFFQKNGIPACHHSAYVKGGSRRNLALCMKENFENRRGILFGLEHYRCFTNMDYATDTMAFSAEIELFEIMDREYPESKFILNTRPLDNWIKSRMNHRRSGKNPLALRNMKYYGVDTEDALAKIWKEERERHHRKVIGHFKDKPGRLLIFDIENDGPQELIGFFPELSLKAEHYLKVTESGISKTDLFAKNRYLVR
jgi:hypothetical protein